MSELVSRFFGQNPDGRLALGYKNLLEAERGFRDLKSTLDLRPVFHRLEPRIRAHVLCWLALLLIRVTERRTGLNWRRIAIELGRVHAVTLTGTAGSVVHSTPLSTAQAGILSSCQVPAPATVTALHPALPAQTPPERARRGVDTRPDPASTRVPAGQPTNSGLPHAHQLRNSGGTTVGSSS
jgi:hypothetical protein